MMKMVELKCKNCGAHFEVEEGNPTVTCKFCNSTFQLEDTYTESYMKTKGELKAQSEQLEENMKAMQNFMNNSPVGKFSKVFTVIFCVIFFGIFGFIGYNIFQDATGTSSFDVHSFNMKFENSVGKTSGFFIESDLDDIITSNKTNSKHIIEVTYKDKTTKDEKEIKEIRNSLNKSKEYDVTFEYDNKGFINKMIIEDID